ncbi:MAG: neutral zinc metallopeptidase [Candidatus Adiutrix sp.]|jgi:predicted metalloprotease|nr:neutral zinc metallopeptidase [Candidatus Adiutrix sp.]
MRWRGRSESDNVEDRRGQAFSGGRGVPLRGGPGLVLLLVVVAAGYYGLDLTPLISDGSNISPGSEAYTPSPEEREMARFTSVALKTTEETWGRIFQKMGRSYVPPKLVLYSGLTETTCGYGQAAMGPFYCPGDQTVYIDLSFYQDMKDKLGGGGDFAQGYVIAHEVGHHVQHLLGLDQKMRPGRQGADQAETNRLSVGLELQADCFAGVWGQAMQEEGILEPGDVEEALSTAEAIGDDRLQRQGGGRVAPDSFTHGSSAQRHQWFKRGFDSGDPDMCNTFSNFN